MSDSIESFEMQAGSGPEAGIYQGRFLGVKKTESAEWGPGCQFQWEVVGGGKPSEHGKVASRTSKPVATATNVTGRMIASIVGPVAVGQKANLATAIGKVFTIVVEKSPKSENTRVVSCLPAS